MSVGVKHYNSGCWVFVKIVRLRYFMQIFDPFGLFSACFIGYILGVDYIVCTF